MFAYNFAPKETIFEGMKRANHQLLSNGFTSFMDATAENDLSRLNFLADLANQTMVCRIYDTYI